MTIKGLAMLLSTVPTRILGTEIKTQGNILNDFWLFPQIRAEQFVLREYAN